MEAERVSTLLAGLPGQGTRVLSELEAKEILRLAGLPAPECRLAETAAEAVRAAEAIGYPVVLKVHSPKISHKSDMGGVKLDLRGAPEVEMAFREILAACSGVDPDAQVTVQPMLKTGLEVILGVSRDAQFGPVIMFGLGGIYTELFNDVAFRLIPVSYEQALDMLASVRAARLLEGYRGQPGADKACLARMIVQLSGLVAQRPEIAELDLNPVLAYPDGAAIADARMMIQQ